MLNFMSYYCCDSQYKITAIIALRIINYLLKIISALSSAAPVVVLPSSCLPLTTF